MLKMAPESFLLKSRIIIELECSKRGHSKELDILHMIQFQNIIAIDVSLDLF